MHMPIHVLISSKTSMTKTSKAALMNNNKTTKGHIIIHPRIPAKGAFEVILIAGLVGGMLFTAVGPLDVGAMGF